MVGSLFRKKILAKKVDFYPNFPKSAIFIRTVDWALESAFLGIFLPTFAYGFFRCIRSSSPLGATRFHIKVIHQHAIFAQNASK
jgi:hypothetical protein